MCVCSPSRALGQETSSLSLRPLRWTKTPGATSLCWHPEGRPKPSNDPHTATAKPHLYCYIWRYVSEAINSTHRNYSISNTCTGCWISSCDEVQVLSDMLKAVSGLHAVWLNKESHVHVSQCVCLRYKATDIKGRVQHFEEYTYLSSELGLNMRLLSYLLLRWQVGSWSLPALCLYAKLKHHLLSIASHFMSKRDESSIKLLS